MSKIEWTDETWNPVTGCTPIATGCKYCYAKEMHRRLRAMGQEKYQHDFTEVRCHADLLEKPLHWRKPRIVFVNSMSDLFHQDVQQSFIHATFTVMAKTPKHTYQVLTKRPGRMRAVLEEWRRVGLTLREGYTQSPLPNVWLGASASTQEDLERVVPDLLATPAAVRFLSLEPLLGPIDLDKWIWGNRCPDPQCGDSTWDHYCKLGTQCIHWVIVGAESGPHRRSCNRAWVLDIRDQCVAAGVPLFIKQIHDMAGKVVKLPQLDGKTWAQMPVVK